MPQLRTRSSHILLVACGLIAGLDFGSFAAAQDLTISDQTPELIFNKLLGQTYQWEIFADHSSFEIVDITAGDRIPFHINSGAPTNSIRVASSGKIGLGTDSPASSLHISTTEPVATLRLQSESMFPSEWEIQVHFGAFQLFDINTFTQPFQVDSGAPQASLYVSSDGNVGFGTSIPTAPIHIVKESQPLVAESVARFDISDDSIGRLEIRNGSTTDGIFHPRLRGIAASQAVPLTMEGVIGIDAGQNPVVAYDAAKVSGGSVVTRPLVVYRNNGVSKVTIAANGVVTATSFNPVSSRTLKHDIEELDSQEATNALRQLAPVKFVYNDDDSNQKRVGFIAEDVPEVVAAPDRQSVPIMDVVALVTRVVKDQQQTIDEQKRANDQQQKTIDRQQTTIDQQQKTVDELMKRLQALETPSAAGP